MQADTRFVTPGLDEIDDQAKRERCPVPHNRPLHLQQKACCQWSALMRRTASRKSLDELTLM